MRKTAWVGLFLLILGAAAFAATPPYKLLKTITVGAEGGWDYLSVDVNSRRLYVSHK